MVAIPSLLDAARGIVATFFVVVLAVAALSDVRHRRIPNWTVLAVAALFGVWVFVGPAVSVASSLAASGIVLLATGVLYALTSSGRRFQTDDRRRAVCRTGASGPIRACHRHRGRSARTCEPCRPTSPNLYHDSTEAISDAAYPTASQSPSRALS